MGYAVNYRARTFAPGTKAIAEYRATGPDGVMRCACGCGTVLVAGNYQYDHIIPWEICRWSGPGNCQVLFTPCHLLKTRTVDAKMIARARRLRKRHKGLKRRARHPLPCGRETRWKLRVRGRGPVRRTTLAERHAATMAKRAILHQPEA